MNHSDTIDVRQGEDFNREAVLQYLRANLEGIPDAPLEVRQFPTGSSNLTYLIRCGDWEAIMRRPPFGPLPPKAHDMRRESQFLKHLHPVFPLVPKPYIFCEDESVIGAPFYVMERKKGIVLDTELPKEPEMTEERCRQISYLVVDALAELHSVDYREAGLDSFGYPQGFLERQVNGWIARYHRSKIEEIEFFPKLSEWLLKSIPVSREATIIHNDYKLNNMLLSPALDRVEAVLDWEMATIADPLFDLGVTLGYWVQADDPDILKQSMKTVTTAPGFITREEFIERYARKTGRDVSSVHFYLVFAYFKVAVVVMQIYYRWAMGQTKDQRFANHYERARNYMNHAYTLIDN
jgi:aminoglycoside phosphotransferase (APT) family kinase protein